jgi:hypothetical protein
MSTATLYIDIPGWALWTAGLVPFAGALAARHWRLQPLWWISVTLVTEFIAFMLAVEVLLRQWGVAAAVLLMLGIAALAWTWPGRRFRWFD